MIYKYCRFCDNILYYNGYNYWCNLCLATYFINQIRFEQEYNGKIFFIILNYNPRRDDLSSFDDKSIYNTALYDKELGAVYLFDGDVKITPQNAYRKLPILLMFK
jgi:hypothetical protein